MASNSIALRLQRMPHSQTSLVLGHVAGARNGSGYFAPQDLDSLMDSLGLPKPGNRNSVLAGLARQELVVRQANRSPAWRLTPAGIEKVEKIVSAFDLTTLSAALAEIGFTQLGTVRHPLIPPELAPPELVNSVTDFLEDHAFETNVFAITRFPRDDRSDPMSAALAKCRQACYESGLELHLASDRTIADDLWANVAAHMWSSRFAIAIFEDRVGRGLNHNVSIEIGSMLMAGRRCALLKDLTIDRLPTDLVGRIYKPVDLGDAQTVYRSVKDWIKVDLGIAASKDGWHLD